MLFVPFTETDFEIATSYLSVADADAIINKQPNAVAWGALDAPTKEMLLMQASVAVDGALSYQGAKTSINQILKFPRNELLTLPRNIEFATAITAWLYSNDDIFKNISREKISKHETEYFAEREIDKRALVFLEPLRATSVKIGASSDYE